MKALSSAFWKLWSDMPSPLPIKQTAPSRSGCTQPNSGKGHETDIRNQEVLNKGALLLKDTIENQNNGFENYETRIEESLFGYPEQQIESVSRNASIFFDLRWFRFLESLDLSQVMGGDVTFHYVVVTCRENGQLAAICPFLICRNPNIYFLYSLDKYFFLNWAEEAARVDPERAGRYRILVWLTRLYRALIQAAGVRTDGWILAVSPLSHRGGIAIDPSTSPEQSREMIHLVVERLKEQGRQETLPVCFFGIEERQTQLRSSLCENGFQELFLVYDHAIPVSNLETMDEYLQRFRSSGRRLLRKEMNAPSDNGIRFESVHDLSLYRSEIAECYERTYNRYGSEHFHHCETFWDKLGRYLYPNAEAVIAFEEDRVLGFSLLLGKKDLWFYRVGRCYDVIAKRAAIYFNLAFYEPLKRALVEPYGQIWLGAGASETKGRRGGISHALYSHVWFPRKRERLLLMPYLDNFSKISRTTQANASCPSSYLHQDQIASDS